MTTIEAFIEQANTLAPMDCVNAKTIGANTCSLAQDYINAVYLLDSAIADITANPSIDWDIMVSEMAYQYAIARDTDRSQQALNYISDNEVKDVTRARIATEASKFNLQTANAIVATITDEDIKNNAIANVAFIQADMNDMTTALSVASNITDEDLFNVTKRDVINRVGRVIA